MTIGALSRLAGVQIETIRYYERIGLLPQPLRSGRYRQYGREDIARLAFLRRARALGFRLDDVRALLALSGWGEADCESARTLAVEHLDKVRTRLADLRAMEAALSEAVRRCDAGHAPRCPLIAVLGGEDGASAVPLPRRRVRGSPASIGNEPTPPTLPRAAPRR